MSDVEAEIRDLREQAAEQGRKRARAEAEQAGAEGRRAAVAEELQTEFGLSTPEEARDKASQLEAALRQKTARARELLAQSGGPQ